MVEIREIIGTPVVVEVLVRKVTVKTVVVGVVTL
tara:strand:- start:1359 stop:1460 length:102 start_codon:yes stop_codon:yes gene_type:complete